MVEASRQSRQTRQRAQVLAAVRASGVEHPTAEAIFRRVRRDLPSISLGTVYRNLQWLTTEGVIGAMRNGERAVRYDPTPAPHDHFVCQVCGRIEDLDGDGEVPAARLRAVHRAGHEVTAHALVLYGRCRRCGGSR